MCINVLPTCIYVYHVCAWCTHMHRHTHTMHVHTYHNTVFKMSLKILHTFIFFFPLKTGFLCIALMALELALETGLALNSTLLPLSNSIEASDL